MDSSAVFSTDELIAAALGNDPWPGYFSYAYEEPPSLPERIQPLGPFELSTKGYSARSVVYLSEAYVARVISCEENLEMLERELRILSTLRGHPVARPLSSSENWLLSSRIDGEHPDADGPWVAELAEFLLAFNRVDPRLGIPSYLQSRYALPSLERFVKPGAHREMRRMIDVAGLARRSFGLTHGDITPANILVRSGHLEGVLDFESACPGPLERDAVRWVLGLGAILGDEATDCFVRVLFPNGIDPDLATAEVVLELEKLALAALKYKNRNFEPYARTVGFLVSEFLNDPEAVASTLTFASRRSLISA